MSVLRTLAATPLPHVWFQFAEECGPGHSTNRYSTTLNGTTRPDSSVQTYVGGLCVSVGDALSSTQVEAIGSVQLDVEDKVVNMGVTFDVVHVLKQHPPPPPDRVRRRSCFLSQTSPTHHKVGRPASSAP